MNKKGFQLEAAVMTEAEAQAHALLRFPLDTVEDCFQLHAALDESAEAKAARRHIRMTFNGLYRAQGIHQESKQFAEACEVFAAEAQASRESGLVWRTKADSVCADMIEDSRIQELAADACAFLSHHTPTGKKRKAASRVGRPEFFTHDGEVMEKRMAVILKKRPDLTEKAVALIYLDRAEKAEAARLAAEAAEANYEQSVKDAYALIQAHERGEKPVVRKRKKA